MTAPTCGRLPVPSSWKRRPPIAVIDAGVVDARYIDPVNGASRKTTTIERLEAQLAEAQARIQELERVIHTARSALDTAA